jgi:hypothetical protein
MDKAAIDIAQALARLSELTIFELRGEWRRFHRMPPPMRLSRDLLVRGITYKLQERAYGGLSTATARKLEQAAKRLHKPDDLGSHRRVDTQAAEGDAPVSAMIDEASLAMIPADITGRAAIRDM